MSIDAIHLTSNISSINSSTEISPCQEDNIVDTMPNPLPKTNPSTPSLLDPKSKPTPTTNTTTTAPAATTTTVPTATAAAAATAAKNNQNLFTFIRCDLEYINDTSEKLDKYKTEVEDKVKNASLKLESFKPIVDSPIKTSTEEDPAPTEEDIEKDLRKLKKSVRKLKHPLAASRFKIDYKALNKDLNLCFNDSTQGKLGFATNDVKDSIKVPNLYIDALFEHSAAFRDFKVNYEDLNDIKLKLCLLCFAVFPEGAIIKKRLMIYWWIGEGFVKEEEQKSAEEVGCEYFKFLITKGFIMPIDDKRWQRGEVGSCKMDPLTRFGVIKLADKAKMFNFDDKGNPKEDFLSSFRACLSGEGLVNIPNLHKLHMLFNVNENLLEFNQGWITELPESVSKLDNLTILDLRACHNLESVPHGIGALRNLTHLDMWECYLLDHMPKQLSSLENLQVLKGFVVGDSKAKTSCTLEDLARLPNLKKLSILAKVKTFPQEQDLIAFSQFKVLCKLTIAWGGGSNQEVKKETKPAVKKETKPAARRLSRLQTRVMANIMPRERPFVIPMLPENLVKLDLQCYPEIFAPKWLNRSNLKNLEKLYIRGGKLRYLRIKNEEEIDDKWKVETLRLKYLNDLEMDWKELLKLFPEVMYLEKVQCPKLTLFPCDQFGVWMKKKKNGN
ncbi:hypothetical protein LguiB_033544 [Lonicera macranthoides]